MESSVLNRRQLTKLICIQLGATVVAPRVGWAAGPAPGLFTATMVLDLRSERVLFREGPCDRRFSPMSTFKVPLAVMGYDAGVLVDERRPSWDYRAEFNAPERARKTINPTSWESESIVWYSQELTRKLGMARFKEYVDRLDYGNRDVSGNPGRNDGLTQAWLASSLAISPDEQVAFVRRLVERALPVSEQAHTLTMAILPEFAADGGWTVRGKTGTGWPTGKTGAADRSRSLGWFVGWAEKGDRRVAFARLELAPSTPDAPPGGLAARASLLADLPRLAGG